MSFVSFRSFIRLESRFEEGGEQREGDMGNIRLVFAFGGEDVGEEGGEDDEGEADDYARAGGG